MIQNITLYLLIGLLWSKFIELSVVGKVEGRAGEPFTIKDVLFQTLLWPISVTIFTYHFIKDLLEKLML